VKDILQSFFEFSFSNKGYNDEAGKEAVKKYAEQFKQYKISTIDLPNKYINKTLQLHENEIM
jgi:hypothetical protein